MLGTIVNVIAILVGSLSGNFLGNKMPERLKQTLLNALGLSTLILGIHMGIKSDNLLIVMGSLLLGGIIGEGLKLDDKLNWLGQKLEQRLSNGDQTENKISKAFVTATLVFCIGPLAIIGAILDGLTGNSMPLFIKSILDGFAAFAFSASLGIGVILSAIPVFLYQGSISLSSIYFQNYMSTITEQSQGIIELSATGGVMIIGLGITLLGLKEIRIAVFLPAIGLAPLIVKILELIN
ncbi:MAG: DUF554 domain-containing protein [Deltaproteobacteria bacterium]|jgi:uncharacterized protein|nr:DUF554 domain-containing protein [Deltaproteobacteria bacterium]MBT4526037.1 DUF554 domain-containing protein [Deltaproteobacteria bacterium]